MILKLCLDDAIFRSIIRMRFSWKSYASYRKCMRYATISVDCPHDASVRSSRLPWDGINLLGNTIRVCSTNLA